MPAHAMMRTLKHYEAHWYRRLNRIVLGACGILLVLVWGVALVELSDLRAQREHELAVKAENLSQVYAGYVERILGHMDTALLLLRDAYLRDSSPDNQDFARITNLLRRGPLQDVALQVAVIGPDGFLDFSDLKRPDQPVDLSDRAHFKVHAQSPVDMLYVSRPLKGRVSGRWSVQLTRRISDPSGKFLGVVVLSVSPEVFAAAGPTLGLRPGDVLTLLDSDLTLLARFPSDDEALGKGLPDKVKAIIQASAEPRLRHSGVDGKVRMIAYRALSQYPLLAGVSLDPGEMEGAIAQERSSRLTVASLFSLAILICAYLALRSLRQREALGRELLRQRQHFADAQSVAQLGSWEWSSPDGLDWSEGMFRIFGLPRGSIEPTMEEWRLQIHPDDRERVQDALTQCQKGGTPYRVEYRLQSEDGTTRVVLERGALEMTESGEAIRVYGMVMEITDQRRLESSLREAEQRLGWALEAARDGVWDWQVDSGQVYFSPRWKSMLGYRPDEFENTVSAWHAAVHAQDLPRMKRAIEDYFSGHSGRFECEFRMRCKDGSYRWILSRGQTFRHDADGRPLRMLGTHSDVTDRKAAEQALRIERSRLAEAQAVAHLGSWEWDIASGQLWWSRETYRIFGLPLSFEPTYESFLECVALTDRQVLNDTLHACLDGRLPYDIEHRILRPDGEERMVRQQGRLEFDPSGQAQRMIGVVQDLTEAHRLEKALRDANARWMFALDGAGTGVWDLDVASGEVFYSARWKEMLGCSDDEIGEDLEAWLARVHPEDAMRVRHELEAHLGGNGSHYEGEHRLRTRSGEYIWVLDRARIVARDTQGRPLRIIGTHTDITARKAAELARQLSEDRYRALISSMAEGVVVLREDGTVTLINDAACHLMALDAGGLLGRRLVDVQARYVDEHGVSLPAERHPVSLALQSGKAQRGVVLGMMRPDGVRQWLSCNCQALTVGADGQVKELVTSFADITRVKEAEFTSRLGDTVVEQSTQPIVITDRNGGIVRANAAFCRRLGYRVNEVLGRPVGGVLHSGRQDAVFYRHLWKTLENEGEWAGEVWNRRRNGEEFVEWLTITAVRDAAGAIEQFVGVYLDLTERKRFEASMWRAANYDALTDLPNRLYFSEQLNESLLRAQRMHTRMALLFVDLDDFKPVNDTLGHHVGDQVLQTVARRLAACVSDDDMVARLGGDEFVVLLRAVADERLLHEIVDGLRASVRMPIDVSSQRIRVGCSVGVAIYPDHGETADALLHFADKEMYAAKGRPIIETGEG